jgi:Cof subfamily protein (haloacid dehalogenase superfamily)
MSTYKCLALDMDGTVLDDEQKVSKENQMWIEKALDAGITVMFATGRGYQSISPYIEELKFNTPIVAVNGSEVWASPKALLKRHTVDQVSIGKLHQLAVQYDAWFWAYAVEGIFNKENWTDETASDSWLKFGYYTEDQKVLNAIRQEVARWGTLEITNSHPNNIELNPLGISKASGLKEICKLLNINMAQVVAMGDSLNDLAMIQEAGLGVAMGNAQDAVKKAADLIAPTNTEHGVAYVIEHYLLKQN